MNQITAIEYVNTISGLIVSPRVGTALNSVTIPPAGRSAPPEELDAREERIKRNNEFVPMKPMTDPKELEGLAVLLASDASGFFTGQVIAQDGGRSSKH